MGKLRIPFVKGPVMAQKTVMFIGKSWENHRKTCFLEAPWNLGIFLGLGSEKSKVWWEFLEDCLKIPLFFAVSPKNSVVLATTSHSLLYSFIGVFQKSIEQWCPKLFSADLDVASLLHSVFWGTATCWANCSPFSSRATRSFRRAANLEPQGSPPRAPGCMGPAEGTLPQWTAQSSDGEEMLRIDSVFFWIWNLNPCTHGDVII